MSEVTPKRIILKCPQQYFQDQEAMVTAFFHSQGLKTPDDYFSHILYDSSTPSKLYLVLDLHYKEIPNVNPNELELQVFKVLRRKALLYVISTFW
jgi:hypothetical protein